MFSVIIMGHFDYPGKFGAVFASIPAPIFAAMYCIFFAYAGE
jgi:solute carrier family 23 (nucleobase transporter), member 1